MADFIKVGFTAKGPMFEQNLVKEVQHVVNSGLLEYALIEGMNRVKDQLYPGHGRIIGNLRNHIGAKPIADNVIRIDAGQTLMPNGKDIVYAAWVEGVDPRNRTSRFKGYKMFENTKNYLNSRPDLQDKYIAKRIVEIIK